MSASAQESAPLFARWVQVWLVDTLVLGEGVSEEGGALFSVSCLTCDP